MGNFTAFQDMSAPIPWADNTGRAPEPYIILAHVPSLYYNSQELAGSWSCSILPLIGGSASIHAFILTSILSLGKTSTPNGGVQLQTPRWSQFRALVTDLDSDATLAIVGSGFLIALPMAIWSAEFRARHSPDSRHVDPSSCSQA